MACSFYKNNRYARTNPKKLCCDTQKRNSLNTATGFQALRQMPPSSYLYEADSVYDNPGSGMVPMKNKKSVASSVYDMPPIYPKMSSSFISPK